MLFGGLVCSMMAVFHDIWQFSHIFNFVEYPLPKHSALVGTQYWVSKRKLPNYNCPYKERQRKPRALTPASLLSATDLAKFI